MESETSSSSAVETGKLQLATVVQFATPSKKWKNARTLLRCQVKAERVPRSPRSVALFGETPKTAQSSSFSKINQSQYKIFFKLSKNFLQNFVLVLSLEKIISFF